MAVVIVLSVSLVASMVACAIGWHLYKLEQWRRVETTRAHAQEYARMAVMSEEKERWLRDGLREQAERHKQEREAWAKQIEGLGNIVHGAMGTLTYGGEPEPAKVTPQSPDAEARMQRRIKEDTIRAGTASIKADYASSGMSISDEDAREQAIAFLNGDTVPLFGGG